MKIAEGSIITDVGHTLVIYDTETNKYRLLVYEEDGVLRILAAEPVVLVTEEEDLEARHKRDVTQRVDDMIEEAVDKGDKRDVARELDNYLTGKG